MIKLWWLITAVEAEFVCGLGLQLFEDQIRYDVFGRHLLIIINQSTAA
jgi:hypothetical protein